MKATAKPSMLDPLSPRKTLLFVPKYPKLYARKPNIEPIGINKPNEKFPRKATKIIGINASEAHIPFKPSIILKAFMIPTTQKIVKGIERIPRLISPVPIRFPRLLKYSPLIAIIRALINN